MSVIRRLVTTNLISQRSMRISNPSAWMLERDYSEPAPRPDRSTQRQNLLGAMIAILATDGFEKSELMKSRRILEEAGASVDVVSSKASHITSWEFDNWGAPIDVDAPLDIAMVEHYAGLVLPGGLINIDRLRSDPSAVKFVKAFFECGKPVAAIGCAPWLLIKADVLNGRTLTSCPSLKTDIGNAGGKWVDQAVVDDDLLITGRKHSDLHTFMQTMAAGFSKKYQDRVKIGPIDV